MKLKWTKKKPDSEGFYFCRFHGWVYIAEFRLETLVDNSQEVLCDAGSHEQVRFMDTYGTEYAGPIPQPTEDK